MEGPVHRFHAVALHPAAPDEVVCFFLADTEPVVYLAGIPADVCGGAVADFGLEVFSREGDAPGFGKLLLAYVGELVVVAVRSVKAEMERQKQSEVGGIGRCVFLFVKDGAVPLHTHLRAEEENAKRVAEFEVADFAVLLVLAGRFVLMAVVQGIVRIQEFVFEAERRVEHRLVADMPFAEDGLVAVHVHRVVIEGIAMRPPERVDVFIDTAYDSAHGIEFDVVRAVVDGGPDGESLDRVKLDACSVGDGFDVHGVR